MFSDWQYGGDLFAGRTIAEMEGPRNPVNGRHLRITEKMNKDEVGRIIDELICRPPRRIDAAGLK